MFGYLHYTFQLYRTSFSMSQKRKSNFSKELCENFEDTTIPGQSKAHFREVRTLTNEKPLTFCTII